MNKKYFYEKCEYFFDPKINITYDEVVRMSLKEFEDWVLYFRKTAVDFWAKTGAPPRMGSSEEEIVESFTRLRSFKLDTIVKKDADEDDVIWNYTRFLSSVNQFFPGMYKTGIGGPNYDNPMPSIYDVFHDDKYLFKFVRELRKLLRQDKMFLFTKTLERGNPEHHNSHLTSGREWIERWHRGDVWEGHDFCLSQNKSRVESLSITADEVKELYHKGILKYHHVSTMTGANWGENVDGLTELPRRPIQLKWYESDVERVFPRGTDVFRLGLMTQAAVNFPPLSAKYIYERFTNHIKNQDTINIYDPCAGWGGRLMGAISIDDRNIHYIGNDPNTENFIEDLGITRYEYLADFYNTRVTGAANPFWGHKNTLDIFQIGSEEIHLNERFKKYKGKLDFVFTSPPYFDRERYSNDDTQSYKKFNTYEKWRDGFLKPTLTTAYEWLRNDRYILWNIADIRIGKDSYTLEQDSIDILTKLGCKYQGKIKLGMTGKFGPIQAGTKNSTLLDGVLIKYEPIFVFYKP